MNTTRNISQINASLFCTRSQLLKNYFLKQLMMRLTVWLRRKQFFFAARQSFQTRPDFSFHFFCSCCAWLLKYEQDFKKAVKNKDISSCERPLNNVIYSQDLHCRKEEEEEKIALKRGVSSNCFCSSSCRWKYQQTPKGICP